MSRYVDIEPYDKCKIVFPADRGFPCHNIPTADVEEVRHGKWGEQVLRDDGFGGKYIGYICPVCKEFVPCKGKRCLNCGAKMYDEYITAFGGTRSMGKTEARRMIRLSEAIAELRRIYEAAIKDGYVIDPLAYALYHTWKEADEGRFGKEKKNVN